MFLTRRKLVCLLWGAKPARFCPQATWEDFECSPISAREAPHSCLISAWRKHECTTTTHGMVEAYTSRVTKPCKLQVRDMAKPISPYPKADNTLDGYIPSKSAILWGRILFLTHRKFVCLLEKPSPHDFVLKRHGKTLSAVPT